MRATNSSNFIQVFGLVCPFTGKVRFVEIAKNAKAAYESLLRASYLFADSISEWVGILESKGVKPGYVMLDEKATNGLERKIYWEKVYNITKVIKSSKIKSAPKGKKSKKPKSQFTIYGEDINAEAKLARGNSSEQNTDSK